MCRGRVIVLSSLIYCLRLGNSDCTHNPEIANLFKSNRVEFEKMAVEWTQKYAAIAA
ncbi:hypothetical protein B0H63DRAFT_459471 [Podospora didyma]|uniref:UBC core domain-containing protein n=1 Tax=Podospora didyma TaxID=330526 RepID=A0AAE0P5P7_9PEZI|nr:hypothetical protein B0H63DRAFT_459471 [Podospora didyma]